MCAGVCYLTLQVLTRVIPLSSTIVTFLNVQNIGITLKEALAVAVVAAKMDMEASVSVGYA